MTKYFDADRLPPGAGRDQMEVINEILANAESVHGESFAVMTCVALSMAQMASLIAALIRMGHLDGQQADIGGLVYARIASALMGDVNKLAGLPPDKIDEVLALSRQLDDRLSQAAAGLAQMFGGPPPSPN